MSQIKGKNTKPELFVRRFLHANGFRFRLHVKKLPGHPDIVMAKYNTIIFVHGCFWHVHKQCKYYKLPKTRTEWWRNKLDANAERDKDVVYNLEKMGWNIITIWECQLKGPAREKVLENLIHYLLNLKAGRR